MQINLYKQNLNFNAKYISEWNCTNFDGCIKKIKVIKFEKEDINFLNSYYKDIENIMHIDDIKKIFIKSSIQTILEVLNSDDSSVFQKTKLYGAIYKNKLCGLLIANIPKLKSYNYKESYSSRHNSAKKEAEIDWLVTWFPEKQILINGIGKALVGQFFNTLKRINLEMFL